MTDNLKILINSKSGSEGFIKVSDQPVTGLTSEQKVILNRKGNLFFNQGAVENAKRIFITTGYSDGLTRIGDTYYEKNDVFAALKMYLLAHNKNKSEPIIEKAASVVSLLLKGEN